MNVIGEVLLRSVTSVPKVVSLWRRFPIGSVALRTRYGAWSRAQYAYGTFHAAQQAKLLGLDGISVIEFGVDRGDGLLALESIAREVANYFGIRISVLGFDTGEGMPSPADYRDLPYVWSWRGSVGSGNSSSLATLSRRFKTLCTRLIPSVLLLSTWTTTAPPCRRLPRSIYRIRLGCRACIVISTTFSILSLLVTIRGPVNSAQFGNSTNSGRK